MKNYLIAVALCMAFAACNGNGTSTDTTDDSTRYAPVDTSSSSSYSSESSSSSSSNSSEAESSSSSQSSEPAIVVSVKQYGDDYRANPVIADGKYEGKFIQMSGKIRSIEFNIHHQLYIGFAEDYGVIVYPRNESDARQLQIGQTVTFRGIGSSRPVPCLEDAVLVSPTDAETQTEN